MKLSKACLSDSVLPEHHCVAAPIFFTFTTQRFFQLGEFVKLQLKLRQPIKIIKRGSLFCFENMYINYRNI